VEYSYWKNYKHHAFKNLYWKLMDLTPEQEFVLTIETGWLRESVEYEDYTTTPTPAEVREIGLGYTPCPDCGNTLQHPVDLIGVDTGVKVSMGESCRCISWRYFYPRLESADGLGPDYHKVRVEKLIEFSANFHSFNRLPGGLELLLQTVREHPKNSYLLAGPAGQGKTTLLAALYAEALREWAKDAAHRGKKHEAVWVVNATRLAAEFAAWENRNNGRGENEGTPVKLPTITEEKIRLAVKHGFTPAIFIEELDKIKLDSDFQKRKFAEIINEVHIAGGQIVATTNLSEFKIRHAFGPQFGDSIVRRIAGPRGNQGVEYTYDEAGNRVQSDPDKAQGGFYIDFWNATITQNLTWEPAKEFQAKPNRSTAHIEDEFDSVEANEREQARRLALQNEAANKGRTSGLKRAAKQIAEENKQEPVTTFTPAGVSYVPPAQDPDTKTGRKLNATHSRNRAAYGRSSDPKA
jgi:DNA polymerase III delta prime subunit